MAAVGRTGDDDMTCCGHTWEEVLPRCVDDEDSSAEDTEAHSSVRSWGRMPADAGCAGDEAECSYDWSTGSSEEEEVVDDDEPVGDRRSLLHMAVDESRHSVRDAGHTVPVREPKRLIHHENSCLGGNMDAEGPEGRLGWANCSCSWSFEK